MGRTSSKRSSSKRKSSKLHSEGRKKKKNRTKSKKLRSRKDSSSSSSSSASDDSRSLISVSTSSSEDEHSRSRSRRKSESKGSKKRGRERSSTKSDKVSKIKKPRKKKLRREPSSTSLSSDSRSCSSDSAPSDTKKKLRKKRHKREPSIASIKSDSHPGDFGSDEDREFESCKGRNREKSIEEETLSKTKSLKVRSRSCSPYSDRYSYGIDSNVPIIPASNTSRRLRSVIVKPSEDKEREGNQDGLREEKMHDHKGHPSFRSKETTDGGSSENLDYYADDVGILKSDEAAVSDLKSGVVMRGGDGGTITAGDEVVREEVSPVLANPENDLESILRLKALENMIKYKGAQLEKLKAPTKIRGSNVVEQSRIPVTVKSEPNTMPRKTQKANLVLDKNVVNENSAITYRSVQAASKDDQKDDNVGKSSVVEPSSIPKKIQNTNPLVVESNLGNKSAPTLGLAGENDDRDVVIKSSISEPINEIPLKSQNETVAESSLKNKVAITSASLGQAIKKDEHDNNNNNNNVSKSSISEPSSSLQPKSEENSSKERQSTTDKDGSQFEQKTMSLMRGGEMVEVSYKVYIPKKAPALARRVLRR